MDDGLGLRGRKGLRHVLEVGTIADLHVNLEPGELFEARRSFH